MIKPFCAGVVITALAGFAYWEVTQQAFDERVRERVIGVSALCRDGMYSTAEKKRGQCAEHGGVERWIIEEE